jgi:hypothetical protein
MPLNADLSHTDFHNMTGKTEERTLEDVRKEFIGMPFNKDVERRLSATGFTFAVSGRTGKVCDIFPHVLRRPLNRN